MLEKKIHIMVLYYQAILLSLSSYLFLRNVFFNSKIFYPDCTKRNKLTISLLTLCNRVGETCNILINVALIYAMILNALFKCSKKSK